MGLASIGNGTVKYVQRELPDVFEPSTRPHHITPVATATLVFSVQRQIRDREEERLLGRENRLAEEKKALEQARYRGDKNDIQ